MKNVENSIQKSVDYDIVNVDKIHLLNYTNRKFRLRTNDIILKGYWWIYGKNRDNWNWWN